MAGLDGEGLTWIEKPLRYDDLDGHARLAADLATPVMLGEDRGVTGWLQAAAIAGITGLPVSSHLYPGVSAHLLRVTPTAHWLEWQDWAHPVLARPFEVKDGLLHPPAVAGNGLEWDEAAVAHYREQ